jgi:hypothetical protein
MGRATLPALAAIGALMRPEQGSTRVPLRRALRAAPDAVDVCDRLP